MKKVLITGVAGFIGFHLCKRLLEKNIEVIGIDNFNSSYDPELKKDRASKLNIQIIEEDIRKVNLFQVLKDHQITHVIHLAASAGVRGSIEKPFEYISNNIEGFVHLLEAAKSYKNLKIIYASSSSVYGKNEKIPFHEKDSTDLPTSVYAATKKSCELMAHVYHHLYDMQLIGLRFFTVYGPWGRPDMAYFSFTKKILEQEPILIFNDGKMQRDFTYIDDIVDGIIASLEYPNSFEIFNLGGHNPVEILTFVSILEKILNKKAIFQMQGAQKTEVLCTYADIVKSQKLLSFNPKVPLEEGLLEFANWYMEYYKINSPFSL